MNNFCRLGVARRIFDTLAPIAMLGCVAFNGRSAAEEAPVAPAATPADSVEDQIVVRGKPIEELRLRIRISEDAFYDRFNEINSDDRFDVHCYMRAETGSRILRRTCMSNGWREADENYAAALVGALRGETGGPPEQFLAQQQLVAREGADEMRRLSRTDPVLRKDLLRLGQAYQVLDAVTGSRSTWTLEHEILGGHDGLPFGADDMVDVRVGTDPWTHPLDGHTFTLTSVSGKIRSLRAVCQHGGTRLEFLSDVEWTLPAGWGACTLTVRAKRDTTFRYVEFQ
jgi:hypothetical protein